MVWGQKDDLGLQTVHRRSIGVADNDGPGISALELRVGKLEQVTRFATGGTPAVWTLS